MRGIILIIMLFILGLAYPKEDNQVNQLLHSDRAYVLNTIHQLVNKQPVTPSRYNASNGVIIQRPIYGELQIVIRPSELTEPLSEYTSIAAQSFTGAEAYAQAELALSSGRFDYEQLLLEHAMEVNALVSKSDRMYQVPLTASGNILLKEGEEQSEFGYLIAFYDDHNKPLGYVLEKLSLLNVKHSTSPLIIALMYHHFSEDPNQLNSVTVHPDTFRKQLQALNEAGYQSIRQQDLLAFLNGGPDVMLPEKSVLITIDDGYDSNYKLAYPILVEERFYASIFVITSIMGETPLYSRHFSWTEALEMYQSGYIDIQSHTYNSHYYGATKTITRPALTHRLLLEGKDNVETSAQYKERIYQDLSLSRQLIEENIGNEVISLTYPYGSFNETVIAIATELGHEMMYTIKEGIIHKDSNRSLLPRINVHGSYSADQLLKRIGKYTGS